MCTESSRPRASICSRAGEKAYHDQVLDAVAGQPGAAVTPHRGLDEALDRRAGAEPMCRGTSKAPCARAGTLDPQPVDGFLAVAGHRAPSIRPCSGRARGQTKAMASPSLDSHPASVMLIGFASAADATSWRRFRRPTDGAAVAAGISIGVAGIGFWANAFGDPTLGKRPF